MLPYVDPQPVQWMAEAEQVSLKPMCWLKLEQLVGHAHVYTCTGIGMRG